MKLSEANICFTAIFRNESSNAYRCLDSVKDLISCVSICDTGSEDNTIDLIEKWGRENDKPTKVHREEFTNFGASRSKSFEMAKASFPEADYCLLIDADMVLVLEDGWKDFEVGKDHYYFFQKNKSLTYKNTRMVKMSLEWKCIGVTHEYWDATGNDAKEQIQTDVLWIDDRGDGGHKHDKYERDERLLRTGLEDPAEPHGVKRRYTYYLGQTLQCMRKYADAINFYRKRLDMGGFDEEIFYSMYQIGICYENMKQHERAAGAYLEAWQMRPTRSEPLYNISKMYREQGKSQLALLFAFKGKKIPRPNDGLFVDDNVYIWKFDEEISISAYYVAEKRYKGKQSVLKLLKIRDTLPSDRVRMLLSNAKFYGVDVDMV